MTIQSFSIENVKDTYCYVAQDVTPVATATDVLTISGANGRQINIHAISVVGTATAASIYDFYLVKRTAANTGGTATNPTGTTLDSYDAAHTARLSLYSANPASLGTGTVIKANKLYLAAGSTPGAAALPTVYNFGDFGAKPVILRNASESLCFNFNGQAVPAGAQLYLQVEWTEDFGA